jgi:CO/xanthine dehydrogenase Mo-binding subunit
MESPRGHGPELSSMAATVEDLRRRVTAIAEETVDTAADRVTGGPGTLSVSTELFEVERALLEAARRLGNVTDALRRQNS